MTWIELFISKKIKLSKAFESFRKLFFGDESIFNILQLFISQLIENTSKIYQNGETQKYWLSTSVIYELSLVFRNKICCSTNSILFIILPDTFNNNKMNFLHVFNLFRFFSVWEMARQRGIVLKAWVNFSCFCPHLSLICWHGLIIIINFLHHKSSLSTWKTNLRFEAFSSDGSGYNFA